MSKTYKNPPLKEAVCEFRFELDETTVNAKIESFFAKIGDVLPVRKPGRQFNFEAKIDMKATAGTLPFKQNFREFSIFLSPDEKDMVQLDGGRVSIHRLSPYTSWKEFFPLIQKVLSAYAECFAPKSIARIGLRYVNEMVFSKENFEYGDNFKIALTLPNLIEKNQKSIFIGSIFEQEEGRDVIKVQFGEKQQNLLPEEKNRIFLLDFDYFLLIPNTVDFDKVDEWLNTAHKNLETTFEEVLTDKAKLMFDK